MSWALVANRKLRVVHTDLGPTSSYYWKAILAVFRK
jgi:hypothetical protein